MPLLQIFSLKKFVIHFCATFCLKNVINWNEIGLKDVQPNQKNYIANFEKYA